MKLTGAQIVWEVLVREGVEVVFGYPGGAVLPTTNAVTEYPIHFVLTRHEQGASHAADGYARATGRVGVAMATSGPGATNLVTGIATAMMDSSPMVCITGQVNSYAIGTNAFQETDVTGVTLPVTKHNYLITRTEDIAPALREAFYVARSGRPGPVLVDITKDAQKGEIDWEWDDTPITLPGYRPDLRAMPAEYERALELINSAERPVILAGQGVIMSGAGDRVIQFMEKANIPATVTLLGIGGIPASHPLNLGMMGMHGEAWTNIAIQEADLLLAFGMRFDDRVTGNLETYATKARKIHIDIDPSEINKVVPVDVGIVGDLGETLDIMMPNLEHHERSDWLAFIESIRDDSAMRDIQRTGNGKLHAAHVIYDLWRYTDGNAIVVTDVGQHQMWEAQYYLHEQPRTLITSGGLGTMGFALPAAVGARFGRPDEEIWVIVGDGGFQMTAAELSTCAQEGIKLNIAVINNHFLGMVRQWQEFFYDRNYSVTPMANPDFVKLAEAHGLVGMRCERREDIEAVVREAQNTEGSVVIDFQVEREDSVYPMVPAGADLDKMIRRPEPTTEAAAAEASAK